MARAAAHEAVSGGEGPRLGAQRGAWRAWLPGGGMKGWTVEKVWHARHCMFGARGAMSQAEKRLTIRSAQPTRPLGCSNPARSGWARRSPLKACHQLQACQHAR